jgi:hypothetical protein
MISFLLVNDHINISSGLLLSHKEFSIYIRIFVISYLYLVPCVSIKPDVLLTISSHYKLVDLPPIKRIKILCIILLNLAHSWGESATKFSIFAILIPQIYIGINFLILYLRRYYYSIFLGIKS